MYFLKQFFTIIFFTFFSLFFLIHSESLILGSLNFLQEINLFIIPWSFFCTTIINENMDFELGVFLYSQVYQRACLAHVQVSKFINV